MTDDTSVPDCGIVMPISEIDNCSEMHWHDVLAILTDSLDNAGFRTRLVSNSDDAGIIQKNIVQNLYANDLVICDVSAKNPNVMFELGMRLAFDRPTIIIKDDKTSYSFDTSVIEHLTYPRDLRFTKIVDFKKQLVDKSLSTLTRSKSDQRHSFLKSFGDFTVAKIETKEVTPEQFIYEELKSLREAMDRISRSGSQPINLRGGKEVEVVLPVDDVNENDIEIITKSIRNLTGVISVDRIYASDSSCNLEITFSDINGLDSAKLNNYVDFYKENKANSNLKKGDVVTVATKGK